MKKLLSVVPALLLFAMIGAPNARADSYTITFTCPGPSANPAEFCPESGTPPSAPDVSFPDPTLNVTNLDGSVYDVTLPAVDSPTDTYTWQWSTNGDPFITQSGPQWVDTLYVTDLTTGILNQVSLQGGPDVPFTDPAFTAYGPLTFSLVSDPAPEPAAVILMLLGVGLIVLMRRRSAFGKTRTA